MKSILFKVILPIVWIAMLFSVTFSKPRHPLMDRWTVLVLLTIVSTVHFEYRIFTLVFLVFGVIMIVAGLDVFDAGPFRNTSMEIAQFRYPQPKDFANSDFLEFQERRTWRESIDAEVAFFRFLLMNLIMFVTCMICDRWVRQSRGSR